MKKIKNIFLFVLLNIKHYDVNLLKYQEGKIYNYDTLRDQCINLDLQVMSR